MGTYALQNWPAKRYANPNAVWVGTFGDPPNLTLTHMTRRLTLILFRLGWKELVVGGYCIQRQSRVAGCRYPNIGLKISCVMGYT